MAHSNGNYREYKLDNGFNVILQKTPTQTVVGTLRVNYGTIHEEKGENGFTNS